MLRIASPILVALFRATRFSSSFFMNPFKKKKLKTSLDLERDYLKIIIIKKKKNICTYLV